MKTISIIRNRGQLTIPDAIRKAATWAKPSAVVSISIFNADEIVIRPHSEVVDEQKVWKLIKESRGIHGKSTTSTVRFLQQDRAGHSI